MHGDRIKEPKCLVNVQTADAPYYPWESFLHTYLNVIMFLEYDTAYTTHISTAFSLTSWAVTAAGTICCCCILTACQNWMLT